MHVFAKYAVSFDVSRNLDYFHYPDAAAIVVVSNTPDWLREKKHPAAGYIAWHERCVTTFVHLVPNF